MPSGDVCFLVFLLDCHSCQRLGAHGGSVTTRLAAPELSLRHLPEKKYTQLTEPAFGRAGAEAQVAKPLRFLGSS